MNDSFSFECIYIVYLREVNEQTILDICSSVSVWQFVMFGYNISCFGAPCRGLALCLCSRFLFFCENLEPVQRTSPEVRSLVAVAGSTC